VTETHSNSRQQTVLMVGGAMRSGTTVIHRALCTASNSNPYISESWFLHDLMNLFQWNVQRFEVRHQDQFGSLDELARLIQLNLRYYTDMVSARYGNPEVLIFKHPELTGHFTTLRQLAPGMRFLVIVRDPRDVIASIRKVNARHIASGVWSPHAKLKTMQQFCDYYYAYFDNVLAKRDEFGQRLMFVRYEDVVTRPVEIFKKISAFSGARYEGDVMTRFTAEHAESNNFNKDLRLKDPLSGAFWSEQYTKDLTPDSIGNYTQTLSATEVSEVQSRLAAFGKSFGYW
jgi:hypothetical protein